MNNLSLQIQIFSCFYMTGLIWMVQWVHYPSFRFIPESNKQFHKHHTRSITPLVLPVMVLEIVTASSLAYQSQNIVFGLNWILLILIWASTFFLSVPLHSQLEAEMHPHTIEKLISTNWPRTVLWTLRSLLLISQLELGIS